MHASNLCNKGSKKARVFPDPVTASATTSLCCLIINGMAALCTGVGTGKGIIGIKMGFNPSPNQDDPLSLSMPPPPSLVSMLILIEMPRFETGCFSFYHPCRRLGKFMMILVY